MLILIGLLEYPSWPALVPGTSARGQRRPWRLQPSQADQHQHRRKM